MFLISLFINIDTINVIYILAPIPSNLDSLLLIKWDFPLKTKVVLLCDKKQKKHSFASKDTG